jgi:hypothetical protein
MLRSMEEIRRMNTEMELHTRDINETSLLEQIANLEEERASLNNMYEEVKRELEAKDTLAAVAPVHQD